MLPVAVAQSGGSEPEQHTEVQPFELEPKLQPEMLKQHKSEMEFKQQLDQIHPIPSYSELLPLSHLNISHPPVVCNPVTANSFSYSSPLPSDNDLFSTSQPVGVAYARVTQMLKALDLSEVMPKFKAAMIKVCWQY